VKIRQNLATIALKIIRLDLPIFGKQYGNNFKNEKNSHVQLSTYVHRY